VVPKFHRAVRPRERQDRRIRKGGGRPESPGRWETKTKKSRLGELGGKRKIKVAQEKKRNESSDQARRRNQRAREIVPGNPPSTPSVEWSRSLVRLIELAAHLVRPSAGAAGYSRPPAAPRPESLTILRVVRVGGRTGKRLQHLRRALISAPPRRSSLAPRPFDVIDFFTRCELVQGPVLS